MTIEKGKIYITCGAPHLVLEENNYLFPSKTFIRCFDIKNGMICYITRQSFKKKMSL